VARKARRARYHLSLLDAHSLPKGGANPDKMHYKELADRVSFFKKTKEGEKTMTDIIELYAAKRAIEAVQKTAQERNIELAKDLLSEGETIERTVRLSKLSEAEVRELASKLTA